MFPAHDVGFQNAGGGLQRVHGWIDALLRNFPAEHGGSVQVSEGSGSSGVGKVISWDIHRLYRGNGAVLGGGDPLLKLPHFVGQGGLIAHSGRHSSQQGRDFAACLHKAENIVNK